MALPNIGITSSAAQERNHLGGMICISSVMTTTQHRHAHNHRGCHRPSQLEQPSSPPCAPTEEDEADKVCKRKYWKSCLPPVLIAACDVTVP
eukprot:4444111-Alexandrium_andersonii.AAC.2